MLSGFTRTLRCKMAGDRILVNMGLPMQVSERIVLAQKAYILFYMRAAPRPTSALTLHSRPPFSPRASASSPRAGAQQGLGDTTLAGSAASAAGAAAAEQPAHGAKRAAGALAPPSVPQGVGDMGAQLPPQQQRAVPASPFAAGHAAGAGAAPAAQPTAPAVAAAGSAGAGLAAKRSAPAVEPGAARPKKRARVLTSMHALPTGLVAPQVGMLHVATMVQCTQMYYCHVHMTPGDVWFA